MRIVQITTVYSPDDTCLVQHALTDNGMIYERHEALDTGLWSDWSECTGNIYTREEI